MAKQNFVFAAGSGIGIVVTPNADGTISVTITNDSPGGAAFDASNPNPGLAAGVGAALPVTPAGYLEVAPGTGEWVPFYTVGT